MLLWPILALIFAGLAALAVQKNIPWLERLARPAVIICLFIWLVLENGLQANVLWFGVGLLFSLAGDILLMISLERRFLVGLAAFLMTHICYIIGFNEQLISFTVWSFVLLFFIFLNGIRILRRIVGAIRAAEQNRLVYPVILYGLLVSLMLYAAMSTIFDPAWSTGAAFFVSAGAFLFYMSDLFLAWNKFVTPIGNIRILNSLTYHLGQISLIAGVISQFG
ncbi:MAG TPA: lysoplasmalogenase [Anaerolineales bacterium]|nr:lysoplasmalogenase [Anaerolineales bacterium]